MSKRLLGQLATATRGIGAVARVRTNGFCCPLCLRFLPVTCATDAHAPAKRLGGRPAAFLCKACNGYLGFSYEAGAAQIVDMVRAHAEGKPTTMRGSMSALDGPHLFVETTFGPSETIEGAAPGEPPRRHHDLHVRHLRPDPELIARFKAAQQRTGGRMNLRWESPTDVDLNLSLLSWAYLAMFQRLGYSVVFSPAGRLAREALLTRSIDRLSPAFIFAFGSFDGALSPMKVGLLMALSNPRGSLTAFPGLAVQFGSVVCVLPHAADELSAYATLPELVTDEALDVVVVPFDALYPPPRIDLGRGAEYGVNGPGGRPLLFVAVDPTAARHQLRDASPPPAKPVRTPVTWGHNPSWPPDVPRMPPEPRSETWSATASVYLRDREQFLADIWLETAEHDQAIDTIQERDPISSKHVRDLFDLFARGAPARLPSDPNVGTIMPVLARIAREIDPTARVVAGDFRGATPRDRITAYSVRVLRGSDDLIVGPHLRYETLVTAMRLTLGGTSQWASDADARPSQVP